MEEQALLSSKSFMGGSKSPGEAPELDKITRLYAIAFLCQNDSHQIVCTKSGRIMFLTFAGKKWNVKEQLEYN